ncbi:hypothetical protein ABK040_010619 [Willaertia magna]
MTVIKYQSDGRPYLSIIPSLILCSNMTLAVLMSIAAGVVLFTKGFHFSTKKTATGEYMKERTKSMRLGKDPNNVPAPKFDNLKELEQEDRKVIYNRLRDPSQFVFEGYGFKRPLTIILYIYRVFVALWMVISMALDLGLFRKRGILYFLSYLTNVSAIVFGLYYVIQTIFGLIYIVYFYQYYTENPNTGETYKNIEDLHPWIRKAYTFLCTIIWLLGEWNHVAGILVASGYWLIILPDVILNVPAADEDILDYYTFSYHGMNVVFNLIEFFMSNIVFRIWHVFVLLIYPTFYLLWVQLLMESKWVDEWPYNVVDYYRNPWSSIIINVFGLPIVFVIVFVIYFFVSKIRLMLLNKKILKFKREFRRKSLKTVVGGIVSHGLNNLMDTAMSLGHMVHKTENNTTTSTSTANNANNNNTALSMNNNKANNNENNNNTNNNNNNNGIGTKNHENIFRSTPNLRTNQVPVEERRPHHAHIHSTGSIAGMQPNNNNGMIRNDSNNSNNSGNNSNNSNSSNDINNNNNNNNMNASIHQSPVVVTNQRNVNESSRSLISLGSTKSVTTIIEEDSKPIDIYSKLGDSMISITTSPGITPNTPVIHNNTSSVDFNTPPPNYNQALSHPSLNTNMFNIHKIIAAAEKQKQIENENNNNNLTLNITVTSPSPKTPLEETDDEELENFTFPPKPKD